MNIDKSLIITETDTLNKMRDKIYQNAINHGWHEGERSIDEYCALFHSEVSEFFEEFRLPEPKALYFDTHNYNISILDKNGIHKADEAEKIDNILSMEYKWNHFEEIAKHKPLGYGIELADLVIRLLDFCGENDIEYNVIHANVYTQDIPNIFHDVMMLHETINQYYAYQDYANIISLILLCFSVSIKYNFDLNEMIRIKHKYNLTRIRKHGRRF